MRKRIALLFICTMLHCFAMAQPATDISCQTNVFYGTFSATIHAVQFNGSTVSDLGPLTPPIFTTLNSVAMGNDITQNSTNRTFYSATQTGLQPTAIIRWTGATWDTLTTDTIVYHNAGAYGPYIYFQCSPNAPPLDDQCIARLDASGNLTKIFTDTTLRFTVADIAVDTNGNIYCFRGPSIGNTTEITVLDPNGNIINSYATNLNNLTTLFGCMFLNGTLYLGHSTTNSSLFPVQFAGSTATLGTAIPMNISMKDLANCYSTVSNTVGLEVKSTEPAFAVTMQRDRLLFTNKTGNALSIKVYDMQGRLLQQVNMAGESMQLTTQAWRKGMYIVKAEAKDAGKSTVVKIMAGE